MHRFDKYEVVSRKLWDVLARVDGAGSRSAIAFRDKRTGFWYKPASWKAADRSRRVWLDDEETYETIYQMEVGQ